MAGPPVPPAVQSRAGRRHPAHPGPAGGLRSGAGDPGQRLSTARTDDLRPYLALSQARALSYDAAADTSRYLLSGNLALYQQDFTRKSGCLVGATGCGPAGRPLTGAVVRDRWLGYHRDHQRVVALATAGDTRAAVGVVTGIRRGDAAFDFFYYDAAVGAVAEDAEPVSTGPGAPPSGC